MPANAEPRLHGNPKAGSQQAVLPALLANILADPGVMETLISEALMSRAQKPSMAPTERLEQLGRKDSNVDRTVNINGLTPPTQGTPFFLETEHKGKIVRFPKACMNVSEAARFVGVSRTTFSEWLHAGEITHVRRGTRILIPVLDLLKWLDGQAG